MEKKERGRVIAVKFEEVLREEAAIQTDLNRATAERFSIEHSIEKELKDLNAMNKACITQKNKVKALIDTTKEIGAKQDIRVEFVEPSERWDHRVGQYIIDDDEYAMKCSGNKIEAPTDLNHNDIVTTLTRSRNSKTARVRTMAIKGLSLLMNGDMEDLEAFLKL